MRHHSKITYIFWSGSALLIGWLFMMGIFTTTDIVVAKLGIDEKLSELAQVGMNLKTKEDTQKLNFDDLAVYIDKAFETGGEYVNQGASVFNVMSGQDKLSKGDDQVNLVFVGDIMTDRAVRSSVNNNAGGDYGFLFEKVKFINEADIAFGNLEGPVSDRGQKVGSIYSFRMAPESLGAIARAGFDVLSVANNHAGDWGEEAFVDTLARLADLRIKSPGGGMNEAEAEKVKIIEKGGMKFGFLAFSDVGPNWLEAKADKPGILLASDKNYKEIIQTASTQVDVLIVSLHYGSEYEISPSERQKELAREAIDAGAKIVAGHHPHVAQPVEEYNGGLIAYSLGNFIFDQDFSNETMKGLVLDVSVQNSEIKDWDTKTVTLDWRYQPSILTE